MKSANVAYETILEALDQIAPVIIIDEDDQIVHANELVKHKLGLEDKQAFPENLQDLISDKTVLEHIQLKRRLDNRWSSDVAIEIEGREVQQVGIQFVPVHNAGNDWLLLQIKEVISQEESAPSESILESINKNLREGLYRSTADGEIVYVNDAFINIFGYDSEAEIRKINSSELYVESTKRQDLVRIVEQKEFVVNQEVRLKKRDGNIFWGLVSTSKSRDENGKVIYDGALRDISALKKIEQQLMLEKQKAEEASRAKEQFLSTMSHELRTPMNAVIGMTHLLLSESPKPEQVQNLRTLKFSAENLLSIINDILDFSKIEAGKLEIDQRRFDIDELLKNISESFILKAKSKDILMSFQKDEKVPAFLMGDSMRISQILNNLISNAIKFTYHGEVIVNCSLEEQNDAGISVKFSVKDTGIGIPKNKLNTIFSLFTQASSSITREFGGTGLGLTITKRLIELQGGTLEVISQPGFGSEFYFSLFFNRATEQQERGKSKDFDTQEGVLKGCQILVAEDNEVNQILLGQILKLWGAELTLAKNGQEALTLVKNNRYDLILMDLQMPVMDGFTASRHIRSLGEPWHSEIPIIAVTATELIEIRKDAQDAGMTDCVSKPFSPDQLFNKISEYYLKS